MNISLEVEFHDTISLANSAMLEKLKNEIAIHPKNIKRHPSPLKLKFTDVKSSSFYCLFMIFSLHLLRKSLLEL